MKFLLLVVKNLRRNKVRSALTVLTIVLLVAVYSMVTTFLRFFDNFMAEKDRNVKLIVSERYRIPSRIDRGLVDLIVRPGGPLYDELRRVPGFHADKYTVWQFAVFSLDPEMKDKEQVFVVVATFPETIPAMTDDLENLDPALLAKMKQPPVSRLPNIGLLIGADRLKKLHKKVGDVFKARSLTHAQGTGARSPIEMEFEVVGTLPPGRWSDLAFIDYEYFSRVLKDRKNESDGKIDVAWLLVDDQESALQVSRAIEANVRELKCETLATAISRSLEPLKGFLWGLKWLVVPAILVVMTVVVANAISITARERTQEIAVLKVLGFTRVRILALVLGEALLLGVLGGLLGGGGTQAVVVAMGGLHIGDGPPFFVAPAAWWWGPSLGAATAALAGLAPAWGACNVRVAEVFSKVA
jgi:putative ABC transport system permease protein